MLGIRKRRIFHESFAGKTVNVLFESEIRHGWWSGLSDEYVRVTAFSPEPLGNRLAKVSVQSATNEDCVGSLFDVSVNRSGAPVIPSFTCV